MGKSEPASGGNETEITLGVLEAVEENSAVTQRSVASELGIALGLTNAYLKRCITKGLIKVNQIPPNRYAYYLTPKGFAEKSRLTAEYLSSSFTFFRRARTQCEAILSECARKGWRRVALVGDGDLAEIATLCAREFDLELVGVLGDAPAPSGRAGLPVAGDLDALGEIDAAVITDLSNPQGAFERVRGRLPEARVLAPAMLRIRRTAGAGNKKRSGK
ncbi:MAG: winged helix-turn-helix transcriptional regulator [Alphaproteobacteria bacterium]